MADYVKMGKMLKELRTAEGLTQAQLAKEFLTTQDNISRLEKGKAFDCDIICSISKFFGVSADYLLGLSDVQSTDTTVKGVCDFTGLSEKAVKSLNSLNCEEKNCLKIINSILESKECKKITDLIYECCEISLLKRYHQNIVPVILEEHDKTLENMGISENDYDKLQKTRMNNSDFDIDSSEAKKQFAAVKADRIIYSVIDFLIHTHSEDRISIFDDIDVCNFSEKIYDEPQMLAEYKIIRLFTDLIVKIKSDTKNDKEGFVLYSQDIYNSIKKSIQCLIEENEDLTLEINDSTKREDVLKIEKEKELNSITAAYLTEYLKSFKSKYIDSI